MTVLRCIADIEGCAQQFLSAGGIIPKVRLVVGLNPYPDLLMHLMEDGLHPSDNGK